MYSPFPLYCVVYGGTFSTKNKAPHIVIIGRISFNSILDFFRELYHKKQRYQQFKVVLLSDKPPEYELEQLLNHPMYKERATYLVGSSLVSKSS